MALDSLLHLFHSSHKSECHQTFKDGAEMAFRQSNRDRTIAFVLGGGANYGALHWNSQNRAIAENILQAVRRDPGRRVLAAVQCQRIHKLEPLLKWHSDLLELVHYQDL